jgi:hypothetical protein
MLTLTLDLATSAQILGWPENKLKNSLEQQEIEGIHISGEWRLSLFILARLLGTTPDVLREYLEDDILARKIDETEGEELLDIAEAQQVYREYLAGAS